MESVLRESLDSDGDGDGGGDCAGDDSGTREPPSSNSRETPREDERGKDSPPTTYRGYVKKVDLKRGYAFLHCPEVQSTHGSDAYAERHVWGRQSPNEGDLVTFSIKCMSLSKPMVVELTIEEGLRVSGYVKSFCLENGYGFLAGQEITERFGRDVFLHSKQIKDFVVDDRVSFLVKILNGKPQAHDLRKVSEAVSWLLGGDVSSPAAGTASDTSPSVTPASGVTIDPDREWIGEVKSFSSTDGYGFVRCAELKALFGRDAFLHQSTFLQKQLHVGDRVSFQARLKKGQPQVTSVKALDLIGTDRAVGSAEKSPTVTGPGLTRACASARPESIQTLRKLLTAGASPNAPDVTGQTPLMIAALSARHGETKCQMLISHGADLDSPCCGELNAVQWARERLSRKFATFLEAVRNGRPVDLELSHEPPTDDF